MNLEAWLFDATPDPEGMRVWVLDRQGCPHSFLDPWRPCFFLEGDRTQIRKAGELFRRAPWPVTAEWTHRNELFSGETRAVLQVRVEPTAYQKLIARLRGLRLYNADIHLVQAWHYERGHFPTALCRFDVKDGRLQAWELADDPWALDYELPPLRSAHLALAGSEIAGALDPAHAPRGGLLLSCEDGTRELLGSSQEQLESLARCLKDLDPDVLTTDWGDSYLIPQLLRLAEKVGRPLPFSRDPERGVAGKSSRSFNTYGRTVYQSGARTFFGRWHLDLKNSFTLKESGLDGLLEVARIAKIPVQRCARATIGTSLSSMQLDQAWRDGVLVPLDKQQTEDFRPADQLIVADKGGLSYEPEVGWFENVAEYDFVSMYPGLMVKENISPETVNCPCCPENKVPEIGHHLCRRRRGLVPKVLEPILRKRARYKALAKSKEGDWRRYKQRANAHKWILVCCFGYLGFKNARFGKIEAHECVTAFGREVLLKAKDAVEGRGLHVLHALVDAVWVTSRSAVDWEDLRRTIESEAGCPVGLEGVYKWLRFCPSQADPLSGVPGRYFGAFQDGELKIRGLACRRRDTPALLKALQHDMLALLAQAGDLAGCRALVGRLQETVQECRSRLLESRVTAPELAIAFHLSKSPEEYVHDTVSTLAAKQLAAGGVTLHPGETVRYIITSARDKVKEWRSRPLALCEGPMEYDARKYLELLERAAQEILDGLA